MTTEENILQQAATVFYSKGLAGARPIIPTKIGIQALCCDND